MGLSDYEQRKENSIEPDDPVDSGSDGSVYSVHSYELFLSHNDFNIKTLVDFVKSNIYIPAFQRNYIWPINRASRLIESAIVGLPIPQIFLYEKAKNQFLIIDGQQRLMSIYYFRHGRFPKKTALHTLRTNFIDQNKISEMPLDDDRYFTDFHLKLPKLENEENPFHGLTYEDLDENNKAAFDLQPIRNVLVRQTQPAGFGSIYEIFSRLNSGGMNLNHQEIRRSMFRSKFFDMLYNANTKPEWRRFIGTEAPDSRSKDVETLLRGYAMLLNGKKYTPPLARFLNNFSDQAKKFTQGDLDRLQQILYSFLECNKDLPSGAFYSMANRFSPPIFESVFAATCAEPYENNSAVKSIHPESLCELKDDPVFKAAAHDRTASLANVRIRLERARAILVD